VDYSQKNAADQTVFAGTRIALRTFLQSLAAGNSLEQIQRDCPSLSEEQFRVFISELFKLFAALREIMESSSIVEWIDKPVPFYQGVTPAEMIERGEIHRLWKMVAELQGGNSGD
jgi:uncharacterized protein (DUF433 family)